MSFSKKVKYIDNVGAAQWGYLGAMDQGMAKADSPTFGGLILTGYTKLGSNAPVIKMKKITGTTGATEGDITNIAHGLTVSKIIGCQVLVTQVSDNLVPPAFTCVVEHEYDFFILASVVRIVLSADNSGSIINGAITVLLTYEE